jgi:hypothetical protein
MELTWLPVLALACAALAAAYGAAPADDSALAPLQVPADVSPELQKIIAAPRNPAWSVLWKTGEEWRMAANAQAAKTVQALPAMRQRLHVTVQPRTMDGVKIYVFTPDVIPPEHRDACGGVSRADLSMRLSTSSLNIQQHIHRSVDLPPLPARHCHI